VVKLLRRNLNILDHLLEASYGCPDIPLEKKQKLKWHRKEEFVDCTTFSSSLLFPSSVVRPSFVHLSCSNKIGSHKVQDKLLLPPFVLFLLFHLLPSWTKFICPEQCSIILNFLDVTNFANNLRTHSISVSIRLQHYIEILTKKNITIEKGHVVLSYSSWPY
jgi:hypothetical protein